MSGGGADSGVKGGQAVVVAVLLGLGGDADSGSGGGMYGVGGGDRRDRDGLNLWVGYCIKRNIRDGT